jgi:transcription-repair coupling factor (superfamily II helicase)
LSILREILTAPGRTLLAGAPEGCDALLLSALFAEGHQGELLVVARDDARMAFLSEALALFAPDIEILEVPAWDCVPYDRVSPSVDVTARRIDTLTRLAQVSGPRRRIVLSTVGALSQRLPPAEALRYAVFSAKVGGKVVLDEMLTFLSRNGYVRTDTVMEPGEFAVRGGLVDLFPPGTEDPLRIDLFGDEVEQIRAFDPISQRSTGKIESFVLRPMSEAPLDEAAIARFRSQYRQMFGSAGDTDLIYESVSAGRKHIGMEHWLPLFYDGLDTLFAYCPDAAIIWDHQADEALKARFDQIFEYYEARRTIAAQGLSDGGQIYHPIPPSRLYLEPDEVARHLLTRPVAVLSPFNAPEADAKAVDANGRLGRDFGDARAQPNVNVYDAVREQVLADQKTGRRVVLAAWTPGSRDRLGGVVRDHGLAKLNVLENWRDIETVPPDQVSLICLGLEHGFTTQSLSVITETDILGDRLARPARRRKKAEQFIAEASALVEGDLVVHFEHGIGQYAGLETISVGGAPHDCLRILYDGNDKLFVPVENIEVLSRYGSEQAGVTLDKLGGQAWQARKSRLKKRIRDMAEQLIRVAAERLTHQADSLTPPEGLWDEFCARFPYAETEDQMKAIGETVDDMASGKPMDRLICGDVGFGKTEVAMRAAFVAAMSGTQVAIVVPTTLLARQHYRNFRERFKGLPVRIEQLSRLVTTKKAAEIKEELAKGQIDIVVGTHALLAKSVTIRDLGLLIVDEEQHFGVAHKERLKQMKANIHVLTLTATPIPRTLQMALTGVREMSIIATPPLDRLAVRTFVLPFDGLVIREAIMREHFRGGQTFYVCPRIADIDEVGERLRKLVPEVKSVIAHGQMPPNDLEEVMVAFSEGKYDVLLSTNIVESGLDMPSVNTIIIHRADMFGLGQLYQLRGRVGRSKARGYAYLTLPGARVLSKAADKRLQVMQALEALGAGFQLASHDLDIRGAGNLLGDEQSGHVREVGIELYQHLLEEAVAAAKGEVAAEEDEGWSPQITLGMPILIPEDYVKDLSVRLSLYRRLGHLKEKAEIEAFAAELIDRFGSLPQEVENLLDVVSVKVLCRRAGIDKIDAGPKGAVFSFRNNRFANPEGLVRFIAQQSGLVKLRPDHKMVYMRIWDTPKERLRGVQQLAETLAKVAA